MLAKVRFIIFHLYLVSALQIKYSVHMMHMVFTSETKNQYIVHLNHDKVTKKRPEDVINQSHKSGGGINQSKRHHQPFIKPKHNF